MAVDDDQIELLIENNPDHMTWDITEIFHIIYLSIVRHLKTLGYVNHCNVWENYDLMGKNLTLYSNATIMNHFRKE